MRFDTKEEYHQSRRRLKQNKTDYEHSKEELSTSITDYEHSKEDLGKTKQIINIQKKTCDNQK